MALREAKDMQRPKVTDMGKRLKGKVFDHYGMRPNANNIRFRATIREPLGTLVRAYGARPGGTVLLDINRGVRGGVILVMPTELTGKPEALNKGATRTKITGVESRAGGILVHTTAGVFKGAKRATQLD